MEGSTYINFNLANTKGLNLIRNNQNPSFGLLIICGCNFGLRISDLLSLTFSDLRQDELVIIEKKTGKKRHIHINDNVKIALKYFETLYAYKNGGKVFISQKGSVYSIQQVNRLIKKYFRGKRLSSHSLRKTFGRRVWEMNDKNDNALIYLSELFNHSNIAVTRRYLGIRHEELKNIYMNL